MVELLQYLISMGLPPSMIFIIGIFWKLNNRLIRLETKVFQRKDPQRYAGFILLFQSVTRTYMSVSKPKIRLFSSVWLYS
ncbi:hypothetical protein FCV63_23830 [Vibrio lentus]|uniref:Uncharacterized protein n=1 Tax=Vibrio lentus TaxID=136468 RepID=A0A4U2DYL0_9VIBR|nr:hypothetical protein FCV63_23830 [Vibrio lentus]TKF94970.1 hypothetical protein FCV71_18355 [Vibrio lentus]TKG04953.1 hypothetical protein FCV91_19255 [Vibrio lentus]